MARFMTRPMIDEISMKGHVQTLTKQNNLSVCDEVNEFTCSIIDTLAPSF